VTKTAPPKSPTAAELELASDWQKVRRFLKANPGLVRDDERLLGDLGLKPNPANVVEFGPAALARLSAAKTRETSVRKQLEAMAQANFAAQAQAHAAVIDLLDARNHSDLARRIDEAARLRFGLVCGVIALEGPDRVPAGWHGLVSGAVDVFLGPEAQSHMGALVMAPLLFGAQADQIKTVALVRTAIWSPARQGVLAFGSADEHGFTPEMGAELVTFLARVVERTAERWPSL
jgi:uncharacterized protein YigA (DUF484 family)